MALCSTYTRELTFDKLCQKKRPQIGQIVQGGGGAYADAMPDNTVRQTLLFSATFPREVQRLAEVRRVRIRRVFSLSRTHSHSLTRSRSLYVHPRPCCFWYGIQFACS